LTLARRGPSLAVIVSSRRRALLCAFALLGLAGAADTPSTLAPWTRGTLDIHQISTGRGNAALVRFPDGTALLVDAGEVGDGVPGATAFPDASRGAGEWIARYLKRALGEGAALDYALVTHFHPDHVGAPLASSRASASGDYKLTGLSEVAEHVAIRKLVDRGFPDYGEPAAPTGALIENYRKFADFETKERGTARERIHPGRADQLVPVREPGAFPDFEVRAVAANGVVWTGKGNETAALFPPSSVNLPEADRAPENPCSIALLIRYGRFRAFTGGDLYGQPEPGAPAWWDVETPIARGIGPTDVVVVDHHGSIEPANPFFLATLKPRVLIVPAWSPTHPSPDVLKRLLSKRIWPAPRDVFVTRLREPTKLTIGPRAAQVASDAGHVVVRVEPGGTSYRVYVVDDTNESGAVKSVHGPYTPMADGAAPPTPASR
jgi:beta-lactamase superfamily II metal-dependent hydrolase